MSKLIRVTLEFDDGKIRELRDEDAQEWNKTMKSSAMMDFVLGKKHPSFEWEEKDK